MLLFPLPDSPNRITLVLGMIAVNRRRVLRFAMESGAEPLAKDPKFYIFAAAITTETGSRGSIYITNPSLTNASVVEARSHSLQMKANIHQWKGSGVITKFDFAVQQSCVNAAKTQEHLHVVAMSSRYGVPGSLFSVKRVGLLRRVPSTRNVSNTWTAEVVAFSLFKRRLAINRYSAHNCGICKLPLWTDALRTFIKFLRNLSPRSCNSPPDLLLCPSSTCIPEHSLPFRYRFLASCRTQLQNWGVEGGVLERSLGSFKHLTTSFNAAE